MKRENAAADKDGRKARRQDERSVFREQPPLRPTFVEGLPEEALQVRPSRGSGRSGGRRPSGALTGFLRLLRAARTRGRRKKGPRERATRRDFRQRCAVRMSYAGRGVKGHFAAHARYLMRDSATNGIETFGTAVDRPLHVTLGSWQQAGDKRLWKLIVSPEFGDRVNLTELTKGLMGAIEHDLNRRLLWAAVEHRNTDHPHVHIALRSVDADGREFRFEPEYLKTAVRNHAQYLCTQQIGNRSYDDIRMAHEREVDQLRFTLLDRRLVRLAELAPREDPSGGQRLSYPQEPLLRARLQFLTQAGIARDLGQGEYVIPDGLEWQLRQMANAADRQRMLAHSGVVISDHRLPQRVTPAKDTGELRGRVLGHAEDERTERPFLILEGTDGVVHFIPHDDRIGMARSQGKLEPNHFISFEGGCLTDLGNADSYLTGRTFRAMPLPTELASASHGWRGWLGRYYLTLLPQAPAREHESLIERVAAELSDIER